MSNIDKRGGEPSVAEKLAQHLSEVGSALKGTTEDHQRAALNRMTSSERTLMIENMRKLIAIADQFEGR